jgi:3-hydroxyisobutyrate dehydrogenase-like beta-hydroxyacid dehydrogenase
MGFAFAERLVRAGVPVIVWNRTQAKVEPVVAEGARWSKSPKDLAKSIGKGVTFLALSDGAAVKRVLLGRSGLVRGAPPGALFVDLSTIDPDESRASAARLEEKGIRYLDAPVAGSVDAVAQGEVTFFLGGDATDVARVRPLLEKMGRRIEHLGPTGSGTSMKLVNNLLTVGITALSTEALALGETFHLDRARVVEALLAGGGRSTMLERKAPALLARNYPAQFTMSLARKDLKLIERAAAREGRTLKMTREARKLLDEAIAQGHSEEDFSAVFEATLARSQAAGSKTIPPSPPGAEAPSPSGEPGRS